MRAGGIVFGLVFVGFWSAITLLFDGLIATSVYRQQQATSYPVVTGRITHSEITSHHDSDGTTYRAEIHFEYEVNGASYSGEKYRYGQMGTSSRRTQQRVVAQFPVGAEVPVYYNPADPSDAVLVTGVGGSDLFLALFLTPFNIVMVGGWALLGGAVYRRVLKPPAGGAPVLRRGSRTHIRLPRVSPAGAALGTALAISFVSIFAIGFPFGFDPPIPVIGMVWGVVLAAALGVYLRGRLAAGSGAKDLVIDEEAGTLSLPQTFDRKEDVVVPIARVREVTIERVKHEGKKGVSYSWAPTLVYEREDGGRSEARLADWHDEARAESLAKFIRDWIGLAPPPEQTS